MSILPMRAEALEEGHAVLPEHSHNEQQVCGVLPLAD
jgi:hypothetical protein